MKTLLKRILLLIGVLLIWDIASKNSNPLFVPNPKTVVQNLIVLIKNGEIFIAIRYSFLRVTVAAFMSAMIAMPIALLIYNVRFAKDVLNPVINIMRLTATDYKKLRHRKRLRGNVKYKSHLKFLAANCQWYPFPVIYTDEIWVKGVGYVKNSKPYYKRIYRGQRKHNRYWYWKKTFEPSCKEI